MAYEDCIPPSQLLTIQTTKYEKMILKILKISVRNV